MSQRNALLILAACVLLAAAFPLLAQVSDGTGVTVNLGGAAVMHRTPVSYPQSAVAKRVEGTVTVQVTLDAAGNVSDARVLSGPDELRKTALTAVLQWHFVRDAAGSTHLVDIAFQAPQAPPAMAKGSGSVMTMGSMPPTVVKEISVTGLPDTAREQLMSSLPIRQGDALSPDSLSRLSAAVSQFDEHLSVRNTRTADGQLSINIVAPGATSPALAQTASTPSRAAVVPPGERLIQVGGQVQAAQIVPGTKTAPVYPPLAKQARIQGTVLLHAVIGPDGTVRDLAATSGHPILVPAALAAVKMWTYKPTLINGQPVWVETDVTINFTLADEPPASPEM